MIRTGVRPCVLEDDVAPLPGGTAKDPALVLEPRLLTALLDRAVTDHPERVALDFFGREWTYAELNSEVSRAAAGLERLGLRRGDRFALCLPNCPYYVVLYFAVLRLGAIVVNLNPLYSADELDHLIRDSGARMVAAPDLKAVSDKLLNIPVDAGVERIVLCPLAKVMPALIGLGFRLTHIGKLARRADSERFVSFADLIANDGSFTPAALDPDDVAVLQYTGGTTGVPKGAMLTHANLAANSMQMRLHNFKERDRQERTTAVLPMFHVFALTTVLNYSIDIAGEIVLLPRFEMKQFLASVRRKPPTQFFGVPTLYIAINELPEDKLPDLSEVRACISGGAPLPLEVRQEFERRTGVPVVEGYGLTEASPIIACNPLYDGPVKDNSCGPAFPATVLEIRDHENPAKTMAVGERGEVCARGPQVMKGYWNRPDATERTMHDGALRTGDIGYLDEDGYLFLVDRIKDLILCSGYNVYPRTIEDAAYEFPAVGEAIAVGVPDHYRGEAPWLFVAPKAGMTIDVDELREFLSHELSKIEEPDRIEVRASLPKTPVGKLSKKDLLAQERDLIAGGAR
jgi:long-chain acyl-CoA synthetase